MSPDERTEQPENSANLLTDLTQDLKALIETYQTDKTPLNSDEFDSPERFQLMSVGETRRKYDAAGEMPPPIRLNPTRVPESLRHLISWAEKWGISDDILRLDAVDRAPAEEIAGLKKIVAENEDLLDHWLAGPEADRTEFSPEFVAFTNMLMAALGC